MAKFAVIKDNYVINTIVAENKQEAESGTGLLCIELSPNDPVASGYIYDSVTATFSDPNAIMEEINA